MLALCLLFTTSWSGARMVRGTWFKSLSLLLCILLLPGHSVFGQEPLLKKQDVPRYSDIFENSEEAPPDVWNNPIVNLVFQFMLMCYYYMSPGSWIGGGATLSFLSHHLILKKHLAERKKNKQSLRDLEAFEKKLSAEVRELEPILEQLQPKLEGLHRLADEFTKLYLKNLGQDSAGTAHNFDSIFELEYWLRTGDGENFLKIQDAQKTRWKIKYDKFKDILRHRINHLFNDPASKQGIEVVQNRIQSLYTELNRIARKNGWSGEFTPKHLSVRIEPGDSQGRPGDFIRNDNHAQISMRLPPSDVALQLRNQIRGCQGLASRLADLKGEVKNQLTEKWAVGVGNAKVGIPKAPFTTTLPRIAYHFGWYATIAGVGRILFEQDESNPVAKFINYRKNASRQESIRIQKDSQLANMIRRDESFLPFVDAVYKAFFELREEIGKELQAGIGDPEILEHISFQRNLRAIDDKNVFRDHIINQIPGASLESKAVSPQDVKDLFLALQGDSLTNKTFQSEDFVNKLISSTINKMFPGFSRTSRKEQMVDFLSDQTKNILYEKVISNLKAIDLKKSAQHEVPHEMEEPGLEALSSAQ